MTEKRFKVIETITYDDRRVYELTKNDIGYYNFKNEKLLAHMICNELNILLKENEQLKKENKELQGFKDKVFNSIDKMLPIFIEHMFDSNYLLWIYSKNDEFEYKILDMDFAKNIDWDYSKISFTKQTLEEWNESNTLKISTRK